MKTNVRTKLGWSKFVLISATLAIIATISALGLIFTYAHADDAADPPSVELNIPVSILDSDYLSSANWQSTDWTKEPSKKFTQSGVFKYHTYAITDSQKKWCDEKESSATVIDGALVVSVATQVGESRYYKRWVFDAKGDEKWFVFTDGRILPVVEGKSVTMKSESNYSFYLGTPQTFSVLSKTEEAKSFSAKGSDFDKNPIMVAPQEPLYLALNSKALEGWAYFTDDSQKTLKLKFSNKDSYAEYDIFTDGQLSQETDYFWLYNESLISKDSSNPTPINLNGAPINFSFEKNEEPIPPEPIKSFKLKGHVADQLTGNDIPNAAIWFYNSDCDESTEPPLLKAQTDEKGNFVMDGCYSGKKNPTELYIEVMAKHYGLEQFTISYDDAKSGLADMDKLELAPATIDVYSDNPHHKSFTFKVVKQAPGQKPEIVSNQVLEYIGMENPFLSNADESYVYQVKDGGVLFNQTTNQEGIITTITITPEPEEGYAFANYLLNDADTYIVGQSIDLLNYFGEDGIHVQVNYDALSESENVVKTGDYGAFVILGLAIICVVSTAVFISRRRNYSF